MDSLLRDRPVFICGHPKSGTSLLRNVLDSHPELVVYPEETGFFRRYLPAIENVSLAGKLALADERLIHIFEWNQNQPPPHQKGFPDRDYSQISYEAVKEAFHDQFNHLPYRHDGDILSAAVLSFGSVTGQMGEQTRHWVEKSPYNERYAGQIFSWWPDALCLHIVRDPRDNFLSYQRKHPEWKSETFATSWTESTRGGLQNQEHYGDSHYRIFRYEDLVTQPEAFLAQISDFLQIQFDQSLTTPSRAGQDWAGNSMFDVRFNEINHAAAGRWKESLPPADAGLLWLLGETEMRKLGYASSRPIPLQSYLRQTKWRLHGTLRRKQKDEYSPFRENH